METTEKRDDPMVHESHGDGRMKHSYTAPERWLVLFAALIGVAGVWALFHVPQNADLHDVALRAAVFWGVYLLGFYATAWKRARGRAWGWFVLGAVALLFLRAAVYEEKYLGLINLAAVIPALLMLHAVVSTADVPPLREGDYIVEYLTGWFIKPFSAIGRFFGAAGSVLAPLSKGGWKVWVGVISAIPLLMIVMTLLINADAVMKLYFDRLTAGFSIGMYVGRFAFGAVVALLFYSFIHNMAFSGKARRNAPYGTPIPHESAVVVLALLVGAYLVFAIFQFTYLTGLKGLPEGLTYSQYAVHGFTETCIVTGINLVLYAAVLNFTGEWRFKRAMLCILLVMSAVTAASSIARLSFYIGAYGLTVKRILSMWFMIFLAFADMVCLVKLFVARVRLLRVLAAAMIVWYVALSAINLDAMIARSVLARADARGYLDQQDATYLRYSLSADAKEILSSSRWADAIYDDVESGATVTVANESSVEIRTVEVEGYGFAENADGSPLGAGDVLTFRLDPGRDSVLIRAYDAAPGAARQPVCSGTFSFAAGGTHAFVIADGPDGGPVIRER